MSSYENGGFTGFADVKQSDAPMARVRLQLCPDIHPFSVKIHLSTKSHVQFHHSSIRYIYANGVNMF
jgi:hypothetical protein